MGYNGFDNTYYYMGFSVVRLEYTPNIPICLLTRVSYKLFTWGVNKTPPPLSLLTKHVSSLFIYSYKPISWYRSRKARLGARKGGAAGRRRAMKSG